jgi:hypothetical protein
MTTLSMLIITNKEELFTLGELCRTHHALRHLNPKTPLRWTRRKAGVRLEALVVGSRVMTSFQAVDRFLAALNESNQAPSSPAVNSPTQNQRENELAAKLLAAAGC